MKLEGRNAIVTGAGHRVGRALAVALGAEKMNVAVHYNRASKEADETVALIKKAGGNATSFAADLTDGDAPQKLVNAVVKAFGVIHVLVNSAAVMKRQPFGTVSAADWAETMTLNLRAPFMMAQSAAAQMSEGGSIVNISDLAAFETWPSYIPHSISKAGIVKMTEGLARVLAPSIRVNAIAPGAVLLPDEWGEQTGERLVDTTPLRRLGDPGDVVDAMLYLLRSDYVTGETIVVDGGRRIRK
ncbi:MAG TPA: SDR family oxidoreductase [Gemmatimonadaceae bacterium]|jgi:NAD(P)-dependent dehydrogenase (short-subunit alcohol dehydrogenase family)|nr:SDR family oxidoreductase [Gemmatimonadaceae bacterium]